MTDENAPDIAEMISLARQDRNSLGQLLERYRSHFTLVMDRQIGPKMAVRCGSDDVVQQAFLRASKSFDGFNGSTEPQFSAWLRTILNRTFIDLLRVRKLPEKPIGGPNDTASLVWNEPAGRQSTPSRRVVRGEQALRLSDLIKALPEMQSEAVRLRHLEDKSVAEISQQLGKSVAATAGLIKRGLQALRNKMSEDSWN